MAWTLKIDDQFTDSQVVLPSHTPNTGGAWSDLVAGHEISVSGTTLAATSTLAVTKNATTLANNQAVEMAIISNAFYPGIMCRLAGTSSSDYDGYLLTYEAPTTDLHLYRVDNGSLTQLAASAGVTYVSGMVIRMEAVGSNIRALLDGVEKIANQSDATYASGAAGLRHVTQSDASFADNFKAYDDAGGGGAGIEVFHGQAQPMRSQWPTIVSV